MKNWNKLKSKIKAEEETIDRGRLIKLFNDFSLELKENKRMDIATQYSKNLQYFEGKSNSNNLDGISPWYDISEIISFDILNSTRNYFEILRDVLWELLVYKTDIQCSNCLEDRYRAMMDNETLQVYLSCDFCGKVTNLTGTKIILDKHLIPANKESLYSSNILNET